MTSPYARMSEYACSTWTFENHSLYSALQSIASAGFTSVELWADTIHFDPRTNVSVPEVRKWLKEFNLSVHSTHGPFRHFHNLLPTDEFSKLRQGLWRKTIEQCAEVESSIMVVHGLDRREYNYTRDQVEMVRESLADLCEYGRGLGVKIALENIQAGKDNPDELSTNLVDHIKHYPGIGLYYCLDIGHAVLNGVDIIDEIKVVGDKLVSLHIHNNNGIDDSHVIPSSGIIDWPYVYHELRSTYGYSGQFVMEVYGDRDANGTLESIKQLFS